MGAALLAALLSGEPDSKVQDLCLLDVLSHSLGLALPDDQVEQWLFRNTTLPTKKSQTMPLRAIHDEQNVALILQVFEGESSLISGNRLIARLSLPMASPASAGIHDCEVTFHCCLDGLLQSVSVRDVSTGKVREPLLTYVDRLSQEQLDQIMRSNEVQDSSTQMHQLRLRLMSAEARAGDLEAQLHEERSKRRKLSDTSDLEMGRLHASLLPQPAQLPSYSLHDVALDSCTAKFFAHLLVSTAVSHPIQGGSGEHAPCPRLQARRIQRIVNAQLQDKFMVAAIRDLEGIYRETGCLELSDVFSHLRVHPASLPLNRGDLNEVFAFHGAPADLVDEICKAGFDPRREREGKLFGAATYFAVNSSKADTDTEIQQSRLSRGAERKLIVARLALGCSLRLTAPCSWSRPPISYDSAWADNRENGGCVEHREIMVYKEQQALPLYVVTYSHECPEQELCAACRTRPR